MFCCVGNQGAIFSGIFITAHPKLPHAEIVENCGQPADVVMMRVAQQDDIQLLYAPRPKVGRNDLLSDVDAGLKASDVFRACQAAAINEHSSAIRKGDKDGVTLVDIENCGLKAASRQTRSKGINHHEQCKSKEYSDSGELKSPERSWSDN